MRRTLCHLTAIILLAGLVQGCANGSKQATPNPGIAAVASAADKAATDFAALAAPARQSGEPPRESDPAVKQLLDTVVDMRVLYRERTTLADLQALIQWGRAISKVSTDYLLAGTGITGTAEPGQIERSPTLTARSNENVSRFAPELGRTLDAQIIIDRVMAGALMAARQSNPAAFQKAEAQQYLASVQHATYEQFRSALITLASPALSDDWRRARLLALAEYGPTAARMMLPEDGGSVRQTTIDVAQCQTDQQVRTELLSLAKSFADYSVDEAPAIRAAHSRLVQASCAAHGAAAQFWRMTRATGARPPHQSDPSVTALLDAILNTGVVEGDVPRYEDLAPLGDWGDAVAQVNIIYLSAGFDRDTRNALEKTMPDDQLLAKVGQNTVQYSAELGRSLDAQLHLMKATAEVFAARLADDPQKFTPSQRAAFETYRFRYAKSVLLLLKISLYPGQGDAWRQARLTSVEAALRRASAILKADDAATLHSFIVEAAKTEKNPQLRARLTRLAGSIAL
jgi:hypothetical protein